MYIMFYVVLT